MRRLTSGLGVGLRAVVAAWTCGPALQCHIALRSWPFTSPVSNARSDRAGESQQMTVTVSTVSSREFSQGASSAKRAASKGPVIITDRGRPAHVLLTIEAYQKLTVYQPPRESRTAAACRASFDSAPCHQVIQRLSPVHKTELCCFWGSRRHHTVGATAFRPNDASSKRGPRRQRCAAGQQHQEAAGLVLRPPGMDPGLKPTGMQP